MKRIALSAMFATALFATTAVLSAPSSIKFVMPIATGLSMGSTGQIVKDIGKALEKRIGIKVDSSEMRYTRDADIVKMLHDSIKKGDLDLSIISPRDYFGLQKIDKDIVIPISTITFFNKPTITACVYTRKQDNITTLAQLKGKKWGGASIIPTRYLFYKNDIDDAPKKYFGAMEYIADENIAAMLEALHSKKIDVFILGSFQVDMAKNADKKFAEIQSSNCFEYDHSWIVVHKKGLDPDTAAKIKSTLLNAHKDKDFAQFKFLFAAIQGHFVEYDASKMKTAQEVYNLAVKNNWDDEEKAFIKAGMKKK